MPRTSRIGQTDSDILKWPAYLVARDALKQLAYSSTAAFLAHYRALSNAAAKPNGKHPLTTPERETLAAMQSLMEALAPDERTLLLADAVNDQRRCRSNEETRRRERAEHKLRRLLQTNGVLRD